MANAYNAMRYRVVAAVFLVSLLMCLALGVVPHDGGKPGWFLMLQLASGLVSIVTVPMAWRWLYLRDRGVG